MAASRGNRLQSTAYKRCRAAVSWEIITPWRKRSRTKPSLHKNGQTGRIRSEILHWDRLSIFGSDGTSLRAAWRTYSNIILKCIYPHQNRVNRPSIGFPDRRSNICRVSNIRLFLFYFHFISAFPSSRTYYNQSKGSLRRSARPSVSNSAAQWCRPLLYKWDRMRNTYGRNKVVQSAHQLPHTTRSTTPNWTRAPHPGTVSPVCWRSVRRRTWCFRSTWKCPSSWRSKRRIGGPCWTGSRWGPTEVRQSYNNEQDQGEDPQR